MAAAKDHYNLLPQRGVKRLLFNHTLTLFYRQDFVSVQVGNLVHYATGPADFYRIYFRSFLEAEVQAQIVLRKITGATMNFVHLS